MWNVKVVYPNGQRVIASDTFRNRLLFAWNEFHKGEFQHLSENEKRELLYEAFNKITQFDYHKGLGKNASKTSLQNLWAQKTATPRQG